KKRSPSMSATLQTFGPGTTWPTESSSTNSVRVSQRLSSQSTRCATTTTPPNPCSARSVNATNSSRGDAGRRRASGPGGAGGTGGVLIAEPETALRRPYVAPDQAPAFLRFELGGPRGERTGGRRRQ